MKLALAVLLALVGILHAEEPAYTGGCVSTVGSYSTGLNNVTSGVKTSGIDMASYSDLYVKATGTASTIVKYSWSHDNSAWTPANPLPSFYDAAGNLSEAFCIRKRARYIRLEAWGNTGTSRVTAAYALGSGTGSSGSPTSVSGSTEIQTKLESISGSVKAISLALASALSGVAEVQTKLEAISMSAKNISSYSAGSAGSLTFNAAVLSNLYSAIGPDTVVATQVYTVTGFQAICLSVVAAVAKNCSFELGLAPASVNSMNFAVLPSATAPSTWAFPLSPTALTRVVDGPFVAGTYIGISTTTAGQSVTASLIVRSKP